MAMTAARVVRRWTNADKPWAESGDVGTGRDQFVAEQRIEGK
jgi:Family of unknown function (DUF6130)